MSIIYRPDRHICLPPVQPVSYLRRQPRGTIWRCGDCGRYLVADGNANWMPPFPFGPTARRIKRLERERGA